MARKRNLGIVFGLSWVSIGAIGATWGPYCEPLDLLGTSEAVLGPLGVPWGSPGILFGQCKGPLEPPRRLQAESQMS